MNVRQATDYAQEQIDLALRHRVEFDDLVTSVSASFINLQPPEVDGALDGADRYGEGSTLGFVALGLMGVGRATGNRSLQATGEDLTTSLLAAWAMTSAATAPT